MTESNANTLPWPGQLGRAAETNPGGEAPIKWVVVRANLSPTEAIIIRGRLESEGIPAMIQQEAVGVVFGLTVGPLGSARVLVPEDRLEEAESLLAVTYEVDEDEDSIEE